MARRAEPEVAIRCIDLSVSRSGRTSGAPRVVEGVTFDLPHGAALSIMGPTGAGKSSLMAILAGHHESGLAVVGGSAEVEGINIRRPGRARRVLTYVTGYLPQSAGAHLPARMTVSEVVSEPITSRDRRVNSRALAVRVASLLDELMLPLGAATKYPYELSAGMRQRVAFARALVLQPRVLIGDDPFANMDVEVRKAAMDAIAHRRHDYGMSALLATNDADVVRQLDTSVLVMKAGHAVGFGHGTDDVFWTPGAENESQLLVP
ncbi:ATP-binding cassette domain-containing protein [Microbacterium sp. C7(2022)]|uniref:ATP-binding cassette domain-containing protein n=1 Tax=Microbacterium sp. C7(2022) TaxID=2992759 RepID=UPI00237BB63A|nr:ATP-binding cassette domain-containing protein [Microbacterium sp. C7(2022)]MDE0547035.1 ATP-binding cassette domain-containing protein [Microbacterium sp. C7(2022)]